MLPCRTIWRPSNARKEKKTDIKEKEAKGKNGSCCAARRAQIGRPGLSAARRVDWSLAMSQRHHVTQTRRQQPAIAASGAATKGKRPNENISSTPVTKDAAERSGSVKRSARCESAFLRARLLPAATGDFCKGAEVDAGRLMSSRDAQFHSQILQCNV